MPSQPNQPPGKRPTRAKKLWSAIKSSFRWAEKRAIEPFARSLDQADIFKIFEKLSPVIEAIGVIAIPTVIWFATESAQEAKEKSEKAIRAQEAVKTYLNQLSSVFLDGDLEKDERLRIITRASTLALLQDPNLEGTHKGQVVRYLTELKLIKLKLSQINQPNSEDLTEEERSKKTLISLASSDLKDVDLSGADLGGVDLSGANLSGANLSGADLLDADLSGADLLNADLSGANLFWTNLSDADLSGANLSNGFFYGTNLSDADLSGADFNGAHLRAKLIGAHLSGAHLRGVKLSEVDLSGVDLSGVDLSGAKLCETKLPSDIKLDPNRDCKELGITP